MMLDEMDKLGAGFHGDPAAAVAGSSRSRTKCHVPRQLSCVPFDLSKSPVLGTQTSSTISRLRFADRMEMIEMPGYIEDEKLAIARRYLVERQLASAGLTEKQCQISDDVLRAHHPRLHP